ncbi:hypothetical protein E2C01_096022 [Portunus trituberculatus]|uniref:Uncharacterized protein n=1 Tax=Portunus trituberculatus TaxID=210409 RepID=A0A5B7K1P8_PORTR|nr:hypothetical protein [Portunus trituberculatus]
MESFTHSGLETRRFPNRRGCKIFLTTARFDSVSRYTQAAVVQWNHACFGVCEVSKRTGRCTARFEGTEPHYWLYASQSENRMCVTMTILGSARDESRNTIQ